MSHYTVSVLHRADQSVEDLLAPYDENLAVEPYFVYSREDAIRHAKECWRAESIAGRTDDEIFEEFSDGYIRDDEQNLYSTYNPDAKWDWYAVGGRWSGLLKLKGENQENVDEARIADIDFSPDMEEYKRALRFWEVAVEGSEQRDGEDFFLYYKPEYYMEYYGDKETYARYTSQWSTFAVVTPDGEWHESGRMGWFGMSDTTANRHKDWHEHFMERFIRHADEDLILTVVDCHI